MYTKKELCVKLVIYKNIAVGFSSPCTLKI